jgi:uncharacterized membrane protein YphA (DoxX/SURF4 family)
VKAYQLPLPDGLETAIGYAQPIVEIVIGLMLAVGLFTRFSALIVGLAMLVFIAGITQAWARGLTIDCGCFSQGGELEEGAETQYLLDILRDTGFLICCVWTYLFASPRKPISVDSWLAGPEPVEA